MRRVKFTLIDYLVVGFITFVVVLGFILRLINPLTDFEKYYWDYIHIPLK